jgi:hypothetical protein
MELGDPISCLGLEADTPVLTGTVSASASSST